VGEQYLEYHRATYTTQSRIKGLNRQLEHALIESESAATLALVRWQQPYPKKNLDQLWQTLLLNQFHDILPGSSIHTVYETAHRQLSAAMEDAARLGAAALAAAAHQRDSKIANEPGGVIWNLQICDQPLVAEIPINPSPGSRLETSDGKAIPIQRLAGNRLLAIADDLAVPAFGAIAVTVAHGEPTGVSAPVRLSGYEMENTCLRVRLREDGTLGSIYDKEHGREVLAGRGNQLWLFTDLPRQYDAWDIDASYAEEGMELLVCDPPEAVEEGPLRAALRTRRSHEEIEIVQTYRLSRHSRMVEIHSDIKWCGRRKILRALFPLAIQTHETWAETSFGAVARSNNRNTPWDTAKFEVAAHRWIDLSEPDYGVSLLNNGKYGHSAEGNILGISLLRSPIYPDPYADEGNHQFVYAIYPHRGTWRNGTVRAAQELHRPLRYIEGGLSRDGSSFLRMTGDPVELACFKRAEDSEDIVLRFYEPHGNRGRSLVQFSLRVERAVMVNILEEELEELSVEEDRIISLCFTPFQVVSIRLTFAPS
jgi:alpha-mannosidase